MHPVLSIIVPVYNAQEYIEASLESLLHQSTEKVEVIVVNDGSTDITVKIINQRFKKFLKTKQLILCTQVNQGVSAARNLGISKAHGDYIGFMDADDFVLTGYVETLLSAITFDADIVEFGFKQFTSSTDECAKQLATYSNTCFGKHNVSDVLDKVYSIARWYPWTRVFKKGLFNNIRFPKNVRFCEDLMTIPSLYEQAKTIVVLQQAVYAYRSNLGSATFNVKSDYVSNLIGFYHEIPYSISMRFRYLKMSVAYAILSCQLKESQDWSLPKDIQEEMLSFRFCWPIYFNVEPRRVLMLCYPRLFKLLRRG